MGMKHKKNSNEQVTVQHSTALLENDYASQIQISCNVPL